MERRTTLLVHAGGASSKKDDERHIQQVEGYLALGSFRSAKARSLCSHDIELAPASTIRVHQPEEAAKPQVEHEKQSGKPHVAHCEDQRSEAAQLQDSWVYIDDTQLACTALESQLFTITTPAATSKALTTRSSGEKYHDRDISNTFVSRPRVERIEGTSPAGQNNDISPTAVSPICRAGNEPVVGSSYLEPLMVAHTAKCGRRFSPEQCRAQLDDEHWRVDGALFPLSADAAHDHRREQWRADNDQTGEGTITSGDTTSELPSSYSLSGTASNSEDGSKQNRPQVASRSISDPGPRDNSLDKSSELGSNRRLSPRKITVSSTPRAQDCLPRLIPDAASHSQLHLTSGQETILKATPTAPAQLSSHKNFAQQSATTNTAEAELSSLAPEIHPPKPATSNDRFITHATEELNALRSTFLAKYCPVRVARQVSVHERGHWSVDCSSWRLPKKLAFWRRLQTWIGNGTAGHGVWCTRRRDIRLVSCNHSEERVSQADSSNEFERLRVYCWGELVEHIYLLLYTASEGSVRKLGLKWIDSKGDTIVQMRGHVDRG